MLLVSSLLLPQIALTVNQEQTLHFKPVAVDGVTEVHTQISAVSLSPQIATVAVSQVDLSVTITGVSPGVATIVIDQVPPRTPTGSLRLNVQIEDLVPPVKDLSAVAFWLVSADSPTTAK